MARLGKLSFHPMAIAVPLLLDAGVGWLSFVYKQWRRYE